MKTTVHIDDDLFKDLKARARQSGESFRTLLNKTLRKGIQAKSSVKRTPYRCPGFSMGNPLPAAYSLDKALALASDLEDAETMNEMERRK